MVVLVYWILFDILDLAKEASVGCIEGTNAVVTRPITTVYSTEEKMEASN